jgi:hypothetical protein
LQMLGRRANKDESVERQLAVSSVSIQDMVSVRVHVCYNRDKC